MKYRSRYRPYLLKRKKKKSQVGEGEDPLSGQPRGLLLALTYTVKAERKGTPIGMLLALTRVPE